MTEHERKIIQGSIEAYQRMITHFQDKIDVLVSKMQDNCCFEEKKMHKLKIKRTK